LGICNVKWFSFEKNYEIFPFLGEISNIGFWVKFPILTLGVIWWKNIIVIICWSCILITTYYRWLYPCEFMKCILKMMNEEHVRVIGITSFGWWKMKAPRWSIFYWKHMAKFPKRGQCCVVVFEATMLKI